MTATQEPRNAAYATVRARTGPLKRCNGCGEDLAVEAYAFKSISDAKLHSRCRECQRSSATKAYAADPSAQRARVAARRRAVTEKVNDLVDTWLGGRPCDICGAAPAVLAITPDGRNIRRSVKDGWTVTDVERSLADAIGVCRSRACR